MKLLVIDIGSTSTKGSIYDEAFVLSGSHRVPTAPSYLDEIRVEQDPFIWKKAVLEIIYTLQKGGHSFDAVTVTSQRSSVFLVDREGMPLCPAIMWQDTRTQAVCERLQETACLVKERTGLPIGPVFGAPKMMWLRENLPERYASAYKIVTIADYVLHFLTGTFVTDHTYGNRSLLLNLHTRRWDGDLLSLFGVHEEKLCALVPPGSCVGTLTEEVCRLTGVKGEIPVYTAGGDQQVAALGLGIFSDGRAEVTHGTGSFCITHAKAPAIRRGSRLICNVSAIPGAYVAESASLTTGAAYDWVRRELYAGGAYEVINREIEETPSLSHGVRVLPHFQGAGAPHWNPRARAAIHNLSLGSTRGDIARALLEGIAVDVAQNLTAIEAELGKITVLSSAGGLTRLPAFNQIQADVYRRPVVTYGDSEATSAGAWISWKKEIGQCRSYEEAFEVVRAASKERIFHPQEEAAAAYQSLKQESADLYFMLSHRGIRSRS